MQARTRMHIAESDAELQRVNDLLELSDGCSFKLNESDLKASIYVDVHAKLHVASVELTSNLTNHFARALISAMTSPSITPEAVNLQRSGRVYSSPPSFRNAQTHGQAISALHALGLPLVCSSNSRGIQLASWLAQHPAIGLRNMLAFTRSQSTSKCLRGTGNFMCVSYQALLDNE